MVAPFMGAWIEIDPKQLFTRIYPVAPFMGAWIEIINLQYNILEDLSRTLYGCVD